MSEFLEALQSSINQMSADGIRISYVASKGRELGDYMADTLDSQWKAIRGMEIQSVGIASISYDEESKNLINMRNQGAMLSDPGVREGYVQGSVARGMEAAGSNAHGSMAGFMGMGVGMNAGGGFMGAASNANLQQMQMNQMAGTQQMAGNQQMAAGQMQGGQMAGAQPTQGAGQAGGNGPIPGTGTPSFVQQASEARQAASQSGDSWTCKCGNVNTGKFCPECGAPRPAGPWTCECGTANNGKFCSECGKPRP